MARYPFLTCLYNFLDDSRNYYSPTTLYRIEVNLKRIHRALGDLARAGNVSTVNPIQMTGDDVLAFVDWLESQPLAPGTKTLYLAHFKSLLEYAGNGAVGELKSKRRFRPWTSPTGPLPCPSDERVTDVLDRLRTAAVDDERHALGIYGLAVLTAATGARKKEVRLAVRGDLRTDLRELLIRHPKGERRYAGPRRALVVSARRAALQDFLDLRAAALERRGIEDGRDVPLVPWWGRAGPRAWSETDIAYKRSTINARLGISWNFRDLRRAWGQNALDRGASLPAVSRGLGHSTTVTTERYYARIKVDRAFEELERAYDVPVAQSTRIERKARKSKKGYVQIRVLV